MGRPGTQTGAWSNLDGTARAPGRDSSSRRPAVELHQEQGWSDLPGWVSQKDSVVDWTVSPVGIRVTLGSGHPHNTAAMRTLCLLRSESLSQGPGRDRAEGP